jgi:hypothetical protein
MPLVEYLGDRLGLAAPDLHAEDGTRKMVPYMTEMPPEGRPDP